MRIVLVTHFYPAHGGGIELVARQLAKHMVAAGHHVIWCASDTDEAPSMAGVSCEPMASFNGIERRSGFPYPLWGATSLVRLSRLIRDSDAVHVHDCIYAGSLAASMLARWHRKDLVVTQHIGEVPLPTMLRPALWLANRFGAWAVLKRARGVAFISPLVKQHFESITGPSPRYHHVANGVDHSVFNPGEPETAPLRSALGFDPDRPLMLFVGRFVSKKRLPLLREMAALRPDWQWSVIGQGPERPQDWGLPNVQVLPPMTQRELVVRYRTADLLVLPSEGEGFPLVVQEAMACGLPACITAEVAAGSAMPEGLWLKLPGSPQETALGGVAAIDAWLAQSPPKRQQHRQACASFAANAWSWETAARAHLCWLGGAAL